MITTKLDEDVLEWLTDKTNRSINQTKFLYEVVGKDFQLLLELEEALKSFMVFYCPGNMAEAFYWICRLRIYKAMKWELKGWNFNLNNTLYIERKSKIL